MWKEKYSQICALNQIFGVKMNGGASKSEIEIFMEFLSNELKITVPKNYLDVLEVVNGMEFNGFIIYGIDGKLLTEKPLQNINGFVENNKIWYENEWQRKYVFLGDSNISWYVYDDELLKYHELSKPSGAILNTFEDIDSLLDKLMEDALQ